MKTEQQNMQFATSIQQKVANKKSDSYFEDRKTRKIVKNTYKELKYLIKMCRKTIKNKYAKQKKVRLKIFFY